MEALLLEDSFEDIFCDPALLECVDNPDGDSQADLEHVDTDSEMIVNEKDSASTSNSVSSSRAKTLNKKEKGKLLEELQAISGVQLVDAVVRKLSQESHMQFYPEREELLALLLDSSGEEMVTICAGLGDNFVCTYMNSGVSPKRGAAAGRRTCKLASCMHMRHCCPSPSNRLYCDH